MSLNLTGNEDTTMAIASAAGSGVAAIANRTPASFWRRLADFVGGGVIAYFACVPVARRVGMADDPHDIMFVGLVCGLFGMVLATMALDLVKSDRFKEYFDKLADKWMGNTSSK